LTSSSSLFPSEQTQTERISERFSTYRDRPVDFVREQLNAFPWSIQRDILESVRDNKRTSVRSCHGTGKTFIAAATAVWFLFSRTDSIVITTAPTARQVTELLWREIRSHVNKNKFPGRTLTTKLELNDRWYAMGLSTDDPTKFQGFHAPDILLIGDEAAGIPQDIYDAAQGILTSAGARVLLIGNPTSADGYFFDTHHELRHMWNCIHIDAFKSPNFTGEKVPEVVARNLITPEWAEERRQEWGEESPIYQSRVRGNFPDLSDDALIAKSWVEKAINIGEEDYDLRALFLAEPIVAGIDVARSGGCENVIYIRQRNRILHFEAWHEADPTRNASRMLATCLRFGVTHVHIDGTGVGGPIGDILARKMPGVRLILLGGGAKDNQTFGLFRDEAYWELRTRFQQGQIEGLQDAITRKQLTSIKYFFDERSKIRVESKKDMRKRNLPSPDRADALLLAFIEPDEKVCNPVTGGQRHVVQRYINQVSHLDIIERVRNGGLR